MNAAAAPAGTRRPRPTRSAPRALLAAVLLGALGVLMGPGAQAGRAAEPQFGTPTAEAAFGDRITFTQPVTVSQAPSRVEILVSYPGSLGPVVAAGSPSQATTGTLTYPIILAQSGLVPNTPVSARWRITMPSGAPVVGPEVKVTYVDTRFTWKTKKGSLVRLHWYDGTEDFATRALKIAEDGVQKAVDLLGVTEKDPIDFFVYASQQPFLQALGPGTREFVVGQAHADIRTMFACIGSGCPGASDAEVARTVPHELTHLVFDTATKNPYHSPPHWLNEGLATYLSEGYAVSYRTDVEAAVRTGSLIPLGAIAGNFPSTYEKAILAYGEGTSAVDFAIRTYGEAAFVKMVRSFAEGRTDAQAFQDAFGVDDAGFEAAWLADLGATEPKRYGPQPAPANPAVPGGSPVPSAGAVSPAPSTPGSPAPSAAAVSPPPQATTKPVPAATPGNGVVSPGTPEPGGNLLVPLLLTIAGLLLLAAAVGFVIRRRRLTARSALAGASPKPEGWEPPAWVQAGRPGAASPTSHDPAAWAAPTGRIPPGGPMTPGLSTTTPVPPAWAQRSSGLPPAQGGSPAWAQPSGVPTTPGGWAPPVPSVPLDAWQRPAESRSWSDPSQPLAQQPGAGSPEAPWQSQPPAAWQQGQAGSPAAPWQHSQPPAAWQPDRAVPPWAQGAVRPAAGEPAPAAWYADPAPEAATGADAAGPDVSFAAATDVSFATDADQGAAPAADAIVAADQVAAAAADGIAAPAADGIAPSAASMTPPPPADWSPPAWARPAPAIEPDVPRDATDPSEGTPPAP